MAVNRIAYLLAGAALGAVGMALVKEGKGASLLQGIVHGGHGLTEKLLGTVETIKEDVEDYLAEARFMHEEKVREKAAEATGKQAQSAAAQSEPAAKKTAPRKTAAKGTKKKAAAAKKTPAAKTAAKKTTAKKTSPKKAPAKQAAGKKSDTKPNAAAKKADA